MREATYYPNPAHEARKAAMYRPPCGKLGGANGRKVPCKPCGGKVELKLFVCEEFGECTTAKPVEGVACCVGCGRYSEGQT